MAHEITATDNILSVREATWHGLGVILPEHPTREEAQAIAHPWEPITEPVYRMVPMLSEVPDGLGGTATIPSEEYQQIEGHQAVVRSDNGATLGVVGDGYEPVSNNEMWDIAEAIQGSGVDVRYETAGSLKGGRKVWILIRLDEPLLIKGDPNGATAMYYSLQNNHDGAGAFRGQATQVRIVCANTSQMADLDAKQRGTEFVFHHTKNVRDRIEEARVALSGWRESVEAYRAFSEHMLTEDVHVDDIEAFIEQFIPGPPPGAASERVLRNVDAARSTFSSILYGETCEGISNTAYGLIQASVEYAEHYRKARSRESQFQRTYLNRNQVVQHATRIARELVGV